MPKPTALEISTKIYCDNSTNNVQELSICKHADGLNYNQGVSYYATKISLTLLVLNCLKAMIIHLKKKNFAVQI